MGRWPEIEAKWRGERVVFSGASEAQVNWGGNDDPNKVCKVGDEYEVEDADVRSWHTKIRLVGIDGRFNSASFRLLSDLEDG